MVKIQENKQRFFVTIPKNIIILKGWKKGQELCFNIAKDGNVGLIEVIDGRSIQVDVDI